jgi:putative DNA primase/helicase
MNFVHFAEAHGLIIDHLISGRWVRCKTADNPRKKNGSYIFDGSSGAIQNWAVHEKPLAWRSDTAVEIDREAMRLKTEARLKEQQKKQEVAAKKAAWMMHQAKLAPHPYLAKKGFPEGKGYVLDGNLLIPMRVDGKIVGCQVVDQDGGKKFLYGQRTKGAQLICDNKGRHILCEGYATALSVRRALMHAKMRYTIHVCFSAANMAEIAAWLPNAFVIADNDESNTGLRAAKKTKCPYWISPNTGEDFNDYEMRVGTERASEDLMLAIC